MIRRPVAVLAVAYGAGIFFQKSFPVSDLILYAAGAGALIVALACVGLRRASIGTAAVVLLACVLGSLAYAPFHKLPVSIKQLEPRLNTPVAVEAMVERVEPLPAGALRLRLRYDSIETPEAQFLCSGLVQVTLQQAFREYRYGQRLRFTCRLRRAHNFNNPGGFDYERFLAHRSIYLTAFLTDDRSVIVLRENGGHPLMRSLEDYRTKLRGVVVSRLESPERDLVLALLLGEKQTLCPEIKNQFARMGLAHLLAISGLHIGIVAGLAFALACCALRLYPRVLLYVDLWKTAGLISVVPVVVYSCVAGLQIPTVRAAIMIVVWIVCLLLNRSRDMFNALGLACCIILLWMPTSLFDISFQLSFCAVFFLILYAPQMQSLFASMERSGRQRSRPAALRAFWFLAGILSASVIATTATGPVTAWYFQQVSLAGVFANAVLVPAIGFMAVPCCLLAAVVLPVSESVAAGLLHAASALLEQALLWVKYWSDAPLVSARVSPPSTAFIVLFYGLLMCLTLRFRMLRLTGSIVVCAAAAVLWLSQPSGSGDGLVRITFLDVGHGDAAIIEFPQGRVMLIDSGGLRSDRFDTGASIVVPALRAMGIRNIDWLVISHPHHDHMGGMQAVLESFQPEELWVPDADFPDPFLSAVVSTALQQGAQIRSPLYGTPAQMIDGVAVEFLSPCEHHTGAVRSYHDLNDSSLVMRISYGAHAFLFTGDISALQEQTLLQRGADVRAQVLKVPHHGKGRASSSAFLDAVMPELAVFSCRASSGRDLPEDVLHRYRSRGITKLRTDLHGAIQIISDGERLSAYIFRPYRKFTAWTEPPLLLRDDIRAPPP
jgi:competence protein ComEC